MGVEADIINVLRAGKRCKPIQIGKANFYHFWHHQPARGLINVAWVKDNRSLQFAQSGYLPNYLAEAIRYLEFDRKMFSYVNAFVAPTQMFAEEVMRWYGARRPWFQFANYPFRTATTEVKRNEVVYVDYSTTVFQDEFYRKLLAFMDELRTLTNCTGILVSKIFYEQINKLPHSRHVRILKPEQYDHQSKYGLLANLTNFRGAAESLPRKLLLYLHCGMFPLVHGTFAESIYYCRRYDIEPLIYWQVDDAAKAMARAKKPRWNGEQFCIEKRIPDLLGYLEGLGK